MELSMFIKSIKLDDNKRILVSLQDHLVSYLAEDNAKSQLKGEVERILGVDFKQLEIGKNVIRLTVTEGKEEELMEVVSVELTKMIEMAMSFMSQMGDMGAK
ncbi:MAG: hypothetical protein WBA54_13940 [Acidaminobacteraceae bacterium]